MAKREKSEKQLANEALTKVFKAMPIEEWADYISANAEGDKQTRTFRVCAKKALSIENMMAYISAHDNKQASKKAFAQASYGIQYEKTTDASGKKVFVKDANGAKVPVLDDKGEPVKKRSLVYAVSYFVKHYLDGLLDIEEKEQAKAFDALDAWL